MFILNDLIQKISDLTLIGDSNTQIISLVQYNRNLDTSELTWCSDKNIDFLKEFVSGSVICSNNIPKEYLKKNCNYILCDNPRLVFKKVLELFFVDNEIIYKIEKSAIIHSNTYISEKVAIGQNVVIEKNVKIGEGTIIGHNTVILKNTEIGKNCKIGSNNTIGSSGFGYEKDANGEFSIIHHIGNVLLEDNVEIGNNTTIDCAVLGSTILRENVKVDNLVHIAHGVEIGENSLIIANTMIAGSVKIGKNSWIAPSSSILNKKEIGENALIGIGAVVIRNVEANDIVVGNPAKSIKK